LAGKSAIGACDSVRAASHATSARARPRGLLALCETVKDLKMIELPNWD